MSQDCHVASPKEAKTSLKSSLVAEGAPGRPDEIEEPANRWLVHPVSRALVDQLVKTPITPNQVSAVSVAAAAAAALSFLMLPWPWNALAGLVWLFVWHVLDGADGALARRTGRASPLGELIDGVCDHVSQILIYAALAVVLSRTLGWAAYAIALAAGTSHAVQSNQYETSRKSYRHWVYGAAWMRQTAGDRATANPLIRAYLALSVALSHGDAAIDAAMTRAVAMDAPAARALYRTRFAPLVKRSGALGATGRTMAVVVSLLLGSPLWYFLYEIVILNLVLGLMLAARRRAGEGLRRDLDASRSQAASAPN